MDVQFIHKKEEDILWKISGKFKVVNVILMENLEIH
jgi:hypothetical protein